MPSSLETDSFLTDFEDEELLREGYDDSGAQVLGKGNRNRVVCWGKKTGMVLRVYMRD